MKWTLLLIACVIASCTGDRKQIYDEKSDRLRFLATSGLGHPGLIDYFWRSTGRFPVSLDVIYLKLEREHPENLDELMPRLVDVFSRNSEWVGYYPIYDDCDSVIVSYFLLSAGIDGKLDNVLEPGTKLHLDDWKDNLELYNPDVLDGALFIDTVMVGKYAKVGFNKAPSYSRQDERSGRKDLLIYVHHLGYL